LKSGDYNETEQTNSSLAKRERKYRREKRSSTEYKEQTEKEQGEEAR